MIKADVDGDSDSANLTESGRFSALSIDSSLSVPDSCAILPSDISGSWTETFDFSSFVIIVMNRVFGRW